MDDLSPYEPVPQLSPNRHHDAFRLASISSGITVDPNETLGTLSENDVNNHFKVDFKSQCIGLKSLSFSCPPPAQLLIVWSWCDPFWHVSLINAHLIFCMCRVSFTVGMTGHRDEVCPLPGLQAAVASKLYRFLSSSFDRNFQRMFSSV